jgi:hypothetical protein
MIFKKKLVPHLIGLKEVLKPKRKEKCFTSNQGFYFNLMISKFEIISEIYTRKKNPKIPSLFVKKMTEKI